MKLASVNFIKLYISRFRFELLNLFILSEILELMPNNSAKRNNFNRKYILIALLVVPVIIVLLVLGKYFVFTNLYDYKLYKLNHLSKDDLPSVYTNETTGYTFNYPKNANVYNRLVTDENSLRVFSDGNNKGSVCDIYVNDPQRYNLSKSKGYGVNTSESVSFSGLAWQKWTEIDNTGSLFDRHFVSWYTEKEDNHVWITSTIEVEGYCESIVSTFRFTK